MTLTLDPVVVFGLVSLLLGSALTFVVTKRSTPTVIVITQPDSPTAPPHVQIGERLHDPPRQIERREDRVDRR